MQVYYTLKFNQTKHNIQDTKTLIQPIMLTNTMHLYSNYVANLATVRPPPPHVLYYNYDT